MRRRKYDMSLADARLLMAASETVAMDQVSAALRETLGSLELGSVVWVVRCRLHGAPQAYPLPGWATPASLQMQIPKENRDFVRSLLEQCEAE